MSFLNTSAHLHHRTVLPTTATREKAVSLFRDHDFLIRLDPELSHYEEIPASADALSKETKCYKITDIMHTLPRNLWDTTVNFTAEMTNIENGVDWVIKAPMGLVQNTKWTIEPAGEKDDVEDKEGRIVLVEDVEMSCSRLLIGTVKGKCEGNWKGVHARFVDKLNKIEP